MQWGNGYGYRVYSKLMFWSIELDKEARIWKHVYRYKSDKNGKQRRTRKKGLRYRGGRCTINNKR